MSDIPLEPWTGGGRADATVVIEFAHRVDCARTGCDPTHSDDGECWPFMEGVSKRHVYTLVERTVTYSDWVESERHPSEVRATGAERNRR